MLISRKRIHMASAAQNGCKLVLFSIVTEYFYLTFAFYLFALLITIIYIPVEKYFLKYSIPVRNISPTQHSRTARTTFKASGFSEPPETIRASPFFRAARNNSGYSVLPGGPKRFGLPEFFKPLETNSS